MQLPPQLLIFYQCTLWIAIGNDISKRPDNSRTTQAAPIMSWRNTVLQSHVHDWTRCEVWNVWSQGENTSGMCGTGLEKRERLEQHHLWRRVLAVVDGIGDFDAHRKGDQARCIDVKFQSNTDVLP